MPFEGPQTHSISDLSFPRDIYASVLTKQGAEALKDMPTPINFKRLSKAVKEARARKAKEEEGAETRKGKGKERASGKDDSKRKKGSSPSLGQEEEDPYKKIKLEQQNDDEDDDLTPLSSPNPSLAAASSAVPARPLPSSPFPLFAHSFTYNPQRPQPPAPAPQGWGYRATAADSERKKAILATYKDRKAFLDLLFADVDPNEDEEEEEGDEEGAEVLDLGEVWLCPSQDGKGGPLVLAEEIRGLSSIETKKFVGQETLFQCEEMSNGMVGDWVDGSDFKGRWAELSWLNALSVLSTSRPPRIQMSAHLSFRRHKSPNSPHYLPFTFHLSIQASVPSPSIMPKIPSDLLDAQRLLFTSLLPAPLLPEAYSKHDYTTTLPFFYEILQPSPPFDLEREDEQATQSPSLKPTLMPFQRRSVKWLLGREAAKLVGSKIAEKFKDETTAGEKGTEIWWEEVRLPLRKAPSLGWEKEGEEWIAEEGSERVLYWNRLTGGLVEEASDIENDEWDIDLRDVNGGMLCEEMGLGKTLEVISLLLLSLQPQDAYLGEVIWNKHLEISYRPCSATLIVAPPTLTQQWADEIAQHAPSLKVLIYDGYKKLPFRASAGKKTKKAKEPPHKKQRTTFRGVPIPLSDEEESDDDGLTGEEQFWLYLEEKGADVVITTYNVLQTDFTVVKRGIGRPRRSNTEYADHLKPRSPLVMIEWERVVMDEVQMQGDGKAAEMVSLIPRKFSLAVSGTPARNATKDLQQALKFIRVPILAHNDRLWNRLLAPSFASMFAQFFGYVATRTTKVQVADEMRIPSQTRMIFPVDHTNIEQTYYQDTLSRALQDLGFDSQGNGFELDLQRARTWIHTLRQIATHLQVGNLNQNNRGGRHQNRLGGGGGHPARDRMDLGAAAGNLLDLKDVLQRMMNQKLTEIWGLRLQMLKAKTNHAIYLQQAHEAVKRLEAEPAAAFTLFFAHPTTGDPLPDALALLTWVASDSRAIIDNLETQLAEIATTQAEAKKVTAAVADPKGKGKARARPEDDEEEEESSDEDEETGPRSDAERALTAKKASLSHRCRECREALHRATFFLGDYWHVHGDTEKENASYAEAEAIRRKMLHEPEQDANAAIRKMTSRLVEDMVSQEELEVAYCDQGGIQTNDLCEKTNDILDLLNSNYELVWAWRGKVFTLLSTPLVSMDEREKDAEGNEYALALEQQIEVEAFLEAYVNAVADRREVLTENRSQLAEVEARNVKKRVTKRAGEATKVGIDLGLTRNDPEKDALRTALREERDACRLNPPGPKKKGAVERQCLKSKLFDFKSASELARNDMELKIAQREAARLQKMIKEQVAILSKLEEEIAVFRSAFNERVLFFAQYQAISDSVAELVVKNDQDLIQKLEAGRAEQQKISDKLVPLQSNVRYMETMQAFHSKIDEGDEEDRECVICRDELVKGVLFACSHLICEDCYQNVKQQVRAECPYCRTRIVHQDVHRVLLNPQPETDDKAEPTEDADAASSGKGKEKADKKGKGKGKETKGKVLQIKPKARVDPFKAALNIVPVETRAAVLAVSIFGSWGSKIDTMIKCLLYLRQQDRKCKAVVFSAFVDALTILERAMAANGIKFVTGGSIDRKAAHKFAEDDSIQCFLLKAEREAAGLTLTCARYVLLCEPTVSPSFELQAIGRVDRISQKSETTVFCFQTNGTMDENIVKLQLSKGLSIFKSSTEQNEIFSTNATRRSEGKAEGGIKKAGADFIKKSSDLASLLFPELHLRHYEPNEIVEDDDQQDNEMEDKEDGSLAGLGEEEAMEVAIARSKQDAEEKSGREEMMMDGDDAQPVAGPSRLG